MASARKTKPSPDLDTLLVAPRRKSRTCATCSVEKWNAVTLRWRELHQKQQRVISKQMLYETMRDHHGYTELGPDALFRHLRICLGVNGRV